MNQLPNVGSASANLSVSQASENVVHATGDILTPFANVFGIEEGGLLLVLRAGTTTGASAACAAGRTS